MRVTMPGAGLRSFWERAGHRRGWWRFACRAAFVVATLGLVFEPWASASAPATSPTSAKNPHRNPAQAANTSDASPAGSKPELAVVYDDVYRSPAKDLLLGLDSERRAEANARFIHGIILEETSGADDATNEYQKSLALDPSNVELSIKIAWDYLRRRRHARGPSTSSRTRSKPRPSRPARVSRSPTSTSTTSTRLTSR